MGKNEEERKKSSSIDIAQTECVCAKHSRKKRKNYAIEQRRKKRKSEHCQHICNALQCSRDDSVSLMFDNNGNQCGKTKEKSLPLFEFDKCCDFFFLSSLSSPTYRQIHLKSDGNLVRFISLHK